MKNENGYNPETFRKWYPSIFFIISLMLMGICIDTSLRGMAISFGSIAFCLSMVIFFQGLDGQFENRSSRW